MNYHIISHEWLTIAKVQEIIEKNIKIKIGEQAERAAKEYGVRFLYRDFRPWFREGQTFAREHGFYIQKYCGCVFSEQERYQKKSKIIP